MWIDLKSRPIGNVLDIFLVLVAADHDRTCPTGKTGSRFKDVTCGQTADQCDTAVNGHLHLLLPAQRNLNDGAPRSWVFAPLPLYWYLRVSALLVRCPFGECAYCARISLQSAVSLAVREPERLWEFAPSVEAATLRSRLSLLRSCVVVFFAWLLLHSSSDRAPSCAHPLKNEGAETVPARRVRVHASRF